MTENELIKQIEHHVKQEFCGEATGHDWYHIDRVRNNAMNIQLKEGGDKEVIELAALLHDISDYKFNGGDEKKGGQLAKELILQYKGTEELANQLQIIVDSISFKGAMVADTTTSIEAKIVQDADRLDAIGAIGIARTFAYGGHVGNPIYDPELAPKLHSSFEEYKSAKSTTINHFYEKLLLLESKMHTLTAKEVAKDRITYMNQFLEQFYKEWNSNF